MIDASTIINNYNTLKGARAKLDNEIEQASALCNPAKYGSSYMSRTTSQQGAESRPVEIVTDYPQMSANKFMRGFYSNLFPANVKWFGYGSRGAVDPAKLPASVRRFLDAASLTVYEILYATNFPAEMCELVEDCADAGTVVMSVEFDPERLLKFKTHRLGKVVCEKSADGEIDIIYEKLQLSALQAARIFSRDGDQLSEKLLSAARSQKSTEAGRTFDFIHYVAPNLDRKFRIVTRDGETSAEPERGFEGKPYISIYVECDEKSIVRKEGFEQNPFVVGRIDNVANGDVYGISPALRALRSMKLLNKTTAATVSAIDARLHPSVLVDLAGYSDLLPEFFFDPGSVNVYNSQGGKVQPPSFYSPPVNAQEGDALQVKLERIIDHFFSADLFTLIQNLNEQSGRQRTAREIMELAAERNNQILTTVSRFLDEIVSPVLRKVFWLLYRNTAVFGEAPEEVRAYLASGISLQYFSPMALAAQAARVNGTIAAIVDCESLLQIDPTILDNLDTDRLARDIFTSRGADPVHVRNAEEVKKLRAEREKAQQAQQSAAMMAELAKGQDLQKAPEAGSVVGSLLQGGLA